MTKLSKQQKRNKKKNIAGKARITKKLVKKREENLAKNILKYGKSITRRQFDAYFYSRMPLVRFQAEEFEWYSFFENRLLGIIFRDVTDNDYGFALMGRDSRKLFRWISGSNDFHNSIANAREDLALLIHRNYVDNLEDVYPQGDEAAPIIDLFSDVVSEDLQHHGYKMLANEPRFEASLNPKNLNITKRIIINKNSTKYLIIFIIFYLKNL